MTSKVSNGNLNPSCVAPDPKATAVQQAREAAVIEQCNGTVVLAGIAGRLLGKHASPAGFKLYRDQFLAKCGQPDDPLEELLVEEVLWAHFKLGNLHTEAAAADSLEASAAYNASAVRLMAEVRKTVLALKEYRSPTQAAQLTLIKQQNVAAGDQQIAIVDSAAPVAPSGKEILDIEVASNQPHRLAHEVQPEFTAESEAGGRRTEEPKAESRPDNRRAIALMQERFRRQTLALLNGSEIGPR